MYCEKKAICEEWKIEGPISFEDPITNEEALKCYESIETLYDSGLMDGEGILAYKARLLKKIVESMKRDLLNARGWHDPDIKTPEDGDRVVLLLEGGKNEEIISVYFDNNFYVETGKLIQAGIETTKVEKELKPLPVQAKPIAWHKIPDTPGIKL